MGGSRRGGGVGGLNRRESGGSMQVMAFFISCPSANTGVCSNFLKTLRRSPPGQAVFLFVPRYSPMGRCRVNRKVPAVVMP